MLYLYLKAFHIIAVMSWMAGMLYLPRLFVYHCDAEPGSTQAKTFEVMEHRLLTYIITPAMGLTWILGLLLIWQGGWMSSGWLHAKLLFVVILSGMHGFLSRCARDFRDGKNTRSQKFYRIINEVPAVMMVIIVILVVVKPF